MNTKQYIDSGILELYVYGLLNETENSEVNKMAQENPEIENEIISIEKAIVNLSTSFSPFLSSENFEKIKARLDLKYAKVIEMKPQSSWSKNLGWAAAIALLLGVGYQYTQLTETKNQTVVVQKEKMILQETIQDLTLKTKESQIALAIVRDTKNSVIQLTGQAVSPQSSAKIYWNKTTKVVYVDASGLPEPPKGMVYQIWSLKLQPQLTPTSIGLLSEFSANNSKIFAVEKTTDAEAFGITLEPAGGSKSPTMEQLYTLGKV